MIEPRPYRDENDLDAMRNLLMRGRKANNGSYYIHTGDLNWWLYYPPLEGDYWNDIYLWDDPEQAGQMLGVGIDQRRIGWELTFTSNRSCAAAQQASEMYLMGRATSLQDCP